MSTPPVTPRKRRRRGSDHLASTWTVPATPSRPPKIDHHPKATLLNNHRYKGKIISFQGSRPNGSETGFTVPNPGSNPPSLDYLHNPFISNDVFDNDTFPTDAPNTTELPVMKDGQAYEDLLKELKDMAVEQTMPS
ncbi:hypothetical protein HD553DRAFT_341926 [Filobasidium floriforme]|uniref:uncharacterized protein n=1 Tax=Filobasidium floriforme TaxID=5210 RepID=UPI001E8CF693|nr:uncharacterized protein HD553DRAFT_341926 [Filobasidium floriforme]KAH8085296.1 hypothetical protein HD553DRAFT_341926 [Filobasidium floriforme]